MYRACGSLCHGRAVLPGDLEAEIWNTKARRRRRTRSAPHFTRRLHHPHAPGHVHRLRQRPALARRPDRRTRVGRASTPLCPAATGWPRLSSRRLHTLPARRRRAGQLRQLRLPGRTDRPRNRQHIRRRQPRRRRRPGPARRRRSPGPYRLRCKPSSFIPQPATLAKPSFANLHSIFNRTHLRPPHRPRRDPVGLSIKRQLLVFWPLALLAVAVLLTPAPSPGHRCEPEVRPAGAQERGRWGEAPPRAHLVTAGLLVIPLALSLALCAVMLAGGPFEDWRGAAAYVTSTARTRPSTCNRPGPATHSRTTTAATARSMPPARAAGGRGHGPPIRLMFPRHLKPAQCSWSTPTHRWGTRSTRSCVACRPANPRPGPTSPRAICQSRERLRIED